MLFSSCNTGKNLPASPGYETLSSDQASPNSCLITGQVVSINNYNAPEDTATSPPHIAMVKVLQISGCRSSANRVHTGDIIPVFFVFSLLPVKPVNPNQNQSYPGLKNKEIFRAWMEQRILPGDSVAFRINGYQNLK